MILKRYVDLSLISLYKYSYYVSIYNKYIINNIVLEIQK